MSVPVSELSPTVDNGRLARGDGRDAQAEPASSAPVPPSADATAPATPVPVGEPVSARLFSSAGRWFLTAAAHVRESAEDFWAEVQARRRERR
jgi:hypothetical protein